MGVSNTFPKLGRVHYGRDPISLRSGRVRIQDPSGYRRLWSSDKHWRAGLIAVTAISDTASECWTYGSLHVLPWLWLWRQGHPTSQWRWGCPWIQSFRPAWLALTLGLTYLPWNTMSIVTVIEARHWRHAFSDPATFKVIPGRNRVVAGYPSHLYLKCIFPSDKRYFNTMFPYTVCIYGPHA